MHQQLIGKKRICEKNTTWTNPLSFSKHAKMNGFPFHHPEPSHVIKVQIQMCVPQCIKLRCVLTVCWLVGKHSQSVFDASVTERSHNVIWSNGACRLSVHTHTHFLAKESKKTKPNYWVLWSSTRSPNLTFQHLVTSPDVPMGRWRHSPMRGR